MRYLLKQHNFYFSYNQNCKKQTKISGSFLGNDKQTTGFSKGPPTGHQQNKGRGQNVEMVLSRDHSQHTWKPDQQQHQNKHRPQFQGY